ncbi:MFS transporter [Streptomyces sp. NPDC004610]|uniref:MFS transporter n=1 Tax=unclassified Streptomyces TaxID=2593676 RepID=UPI0033B8C825
MLFARFAVCAVFLLDGMIYGSWAAQVPALARQTGSGNAVLGLVLLGPAAAMVLTAVPAGRACARFGARRVAAVCLGAGFAVLALVGTADTPLRLGLTLAVLGGLMGMVDVAANVAAVDVVRALDRPLMPLFHANFSLGGLLGAGGAALASLAGAGPTTQLAVVAVMGAGATGVVVRGVPEGRRVRRERGRERSVRRARGAWREGWWRRGRWREGWVPGERGAEGRAGAVEELARGGMGVRPGASARVGSGGRRVLVIACGAVLVAVAEGACSEWSGLFLVRRHQVPDAVGAGGYALFTAVVAVTRLCGERLERLLGPYGLVGGGALLAAVGLLVTATAPVTGAALAGLGLAGAGLACAFPVLIGLAGGAGEGGGEREIAWVTTVAYAGMLGGPPVIGWTAGVAGLPVAMAVVALACLAVVPVAWSARRAARRTAGGTAGGTASPVRSGASVQVDR